MIRQAGEHAATGETTRRDPERFAYATLDALSEHVAVLDERGIVVAVNRAWREFAVANSLSMEGLSVGANYFAACHNATGRGAEDAARFADGLHAVISGELGEFSLEYPCHSPTQQRWFIARATRFEFEGETRAVVTHANITTRKLAEEAIRFHSHLLDTVEQAVIATDLSGTIIYWNRFAEKLYGWPAAEIVGRNIMEVVLPEAAREQASEVMSRLQAGQSWSGEFTVRRRDGATFRAFITDTPIYNTEGTMIGIVGVSRDITERKRAEEERERLLRSLEVERARLTYLFTHAPAFVAVLRGPDHVFELANPPYLQMVGHRDVLGKPAREALPEVEGQGYFELLDNAYLTGEPHVGRGMRLLVQREPEGAPEELFFDFVYQPMFDADGSVSDIFVHGVDVTEHKRAEDSLKQLADEVERQLHKFDAVVSSVQDFIYMFDLQGRFTYINNPLLDLWQKTFEQAVGKNFYDLDYPPDLAERLQSQIQEVITSRRPLKDETPYTSASGTRAYEYIFVPLISTDGAVEAVAGVTRDITERKLAEDALRESEEWLRAIFEASRDGIIVEDDERIAYVNHAYARLFGYEDPDELKGKHISAVLSAAAEERLLDYGKRRMRGEAAPTVYEFKGKRRDGQMIDLEASVSISNVGGKAYITTAVRDIAERKRAEEELRGAYDELERRVEERTAELARANATLKEENAERLRAEESRKKLLRRLVTAQEEERRRISRELHDQMGQQLAALMMGLKRLDADSHGRQSALHTLRQLQELTDQLSREVHTLAWGLRPPALDDLGLHTAIYNYVEEWAERSRVPVDFHSAGFVGEGRLPFSHETALYRIAQEALTNVFKHSGADRVSFILERRGDHVLAVVEDNGKGFDVEALLEPSARERRMGLLGMRERATLLGGTLNIESSPGAGTGVFVRIPVGAGDETGDEEGGAQRG
ncbi:MAG: PAS domain S-box protein [Acidobacteria bacterium]|nr:PAS domain S-box protein [Acidobacteriota bacterium]